MKEAYFQEKFDNNKVKCLACAHNCVISEGGRGKCLIRSNLHGSLFLDVYGSAISIGVDVIEKKPLYHFLPGSKTFSFGTFGCNFKCVFCQNHDISMPKNFNNLSFKKNLSPEQAVELAIENNCESISYTYTEPAIFVEYVLDTVVLARKKGLKNILVTNGFFSQESLNEIVKVVDAVNIDLKSFSDEFYKKQCKATLKPVLDSIKFFYKHNVWVEVTTLIIPGLNDSDEELKSIAKFIAGVDKEIPWHISRFFPMHDLLDKEITSLEILDRAKKIGEREGLKFVYLGNIPGSSVTSCENCGKELIVRNKFETIINFEKGKCYCGKILRGVF